MLKLNNMIPIKVTRSDNTELIFPTVTSCAAYFKKSRSFISNRLKDGKLYEGFKFEVYEREKIPVHGSGRYPSNPVTLFTR